VLQATRTVVGRVRRAGVTAQRWTSRSSLENNTMLNGPRATYKRSLCRPQLWRRASATPTW